MAPKGYYSSLLRLGVREEVEERFGDEYVALEPRIAEALWSASVAGDQNQSCIFVPTHSAVIQVPTGMRPREEN